MPPAPAAAPPLILAPTWLLSVPSRVLASAYVPAVADTSCDIPSLSHVALATASAEAPAYASLVHAPPLGRLTVMFTLAIAPALAVASATNPSKVKTALAIA